MTTLSQIDHTPQLFFLDLEVDRVQKESGEPLPCITQIAVYSPLRDVATSTFEAYVKPPKVLRTKSEEFHFEHGHVEPPKHTFKKIWPHLKEWVSKSLKKEQQALFVMHNGYEHDWPILRNELARFNEGLPITWRPFCSLYLAKALRLDGELTLTALCHKYGIPLLPAHNAYNDAVMLSQVFEKMIGGADLGSVLRAALDQTHPIRKVSEIIKTDVTALIVFFDFESTGLFPKEGTRGENPRAVELAGHVPLTGASFSSLIDPGIPIPADAAAIHGIKDEDVKGRPGFKHVFKAFEDWMEGELKKTSRKVICLAGHNIWGYDLPLYRAECERTGHPKKEYKSFDTLFLSRSLFSGLKIPNHKLQTLRELLEIPQDIAHRASGDVAVNTKVYQKMVEGVPESKINEALMARHPVLSLKAQIELYGMFKPHLVVQKLIAPSQGAAAAAAASSNNDSYVGEKRGRDEDKVALEAKRVRHEGDKDVSLPLAEKKAATVPELFSRTASFQKPTSGSLAAAAAAAAKEDEWDEVFEIRDDMQQ